MLQDDICKVLGVSENTLRKYYKQELDVGLAESCANVANTLLQKALNGDTTAAIFFLKARAKWSERVEVTGNDGGPIQTEAVSRDADEFASRVIRLSSREGEGGGTSEA